jgi:hypothetical protein
MEKNAQKKAVANTCQLDLFAQSVDVKQGFSTCNIDAYTKKINGTVIHLASYKSQQQVSMFYKEVEKMTAHLK